MSKINFKSIMFKGNDLSLGDRCVDIIKLKHALGLIGFTLDENSNKFDYEVKRAVEDFQSENGLGVDGIVGKGTWYAIMSPELSSRYISFMKHWEIDKEDKQYYNSNTGKFICDYVGDGKLTIGYGCTHHDYKRYEEIDEEEATRLLKRDLFSSIKDVCQTLGNISVKYHKDICLTKNQYESFVDYQFNSGAIGSAEDTEIRVKTGSLCIKFT